MKENKKTKQFPMKLVVGGAVALLFLAFVGSFGYSFVKSKLMNKVPTGLSLGGLPAGSTVKTKAEGIAVCKQSGVDYCWAAVAAQFNDLSVCKQAPDKKACESDANEFLQMNQEQTDNKEEITNNEDTTVTDTKTNEDSFWAECKKGTANKSDIGEVVITGKERITFEGKTNDTCCYEVSETIEGEADRVHKTCMFTDGSDSALIYNKIDGKFVIWGASIKSGSEECQYFYTEEGVFQGKNCF